MELKTYQARSMSDALARVKRELGKGAMILHTRTIRRGGILGIGARTFVEITATADPKVIAARSGAGRPDELRAGVPGGASAPVQGRVAAAYGIEKPAPAAGGPGIPQSAASTGAPHDIREDLLAIRGMVRDLLLQNDPARPADVPEELIEHYTRMISHEVARGLVMEIIDRVRPRLGESEAPMDGEDRETRSQGVSAENVREELLRYIGESLPPAAPLQLVNENRPTIVALVGPTGVGKTTTLAKLAAHMKLREGRSVGLITIDSYRIAAVEQLKTYAQIMQIPLIPVTSPAEMGDAIRRLSSVDLILIDTAGRSQKDDPRIAELRTYLAAAVPDQVHLVLSTTASEAAIRQAIEKFSVLGARQLIFTKLDEAVGFGVILNVLRSFDLRLSYLTTGQAVPDDIEVGSARRVAELILSPGVTPAGPPAETPGSHASLPNRAAAAQGV